jgi:hypothetical protein
MAGVPVEKLVQLAEQIAEKAADNEQLWNEAIAHSQKIEAAYAAGQKELRVLVAEFNVLAQQVSDGAEGTSTVRPVSGGQAVGSQGAAAQGGADHAHSAASAGG